MLSPWAVRALECVAANQQVILFGQQRLAGLWSVQVSSWHLRCHLLRHRSGHRVCLGFCFHNQGQFCVECWHEFFVFSSWIVVLTSFISFVALLTLLASFQVHPVLENQWLDCSSCLLALRLILWNTLRAGRAYMVLLIECNLFLCLVQVTIQSLFKTHTLWAECRCFSRR